MNGREVRGGGREDPPPRKRVGWRHHDRVGVLGGACAQWAWWQRRQRGRRKDLSECTDAGDRPFALQQGGWAAGPSGVCRPRRARAGPQPGSPDGQDVLRSKRSLAGRISGPVAGTTARRRLTTPEGTQQCRYQPTCGGSAGNVTETGTSRETI